MIPVSGDTLTVDGKPYRRVHRWGTCLLWSFWVGDSSLFPYFVVAIVDCTDRTHPLWNWRPTR